MCPWTLDKILKHKIGKEGVELKKESDIWSLGMIFFEMIFGKRPYDAKDVYSLKNMIDQQQPLRFPQNITIETDESAEKAMKAIKKFIEKCLCVDDKNNKLSDNYDYVKEHVFGAELYVESSEL